MDNGMNGHHGADVVFHVDLVEFKPEEETVPLPLQTLEEKLVKELLLSQEDVAKDLAVSKIYFLCLKNFSNHFKFSKMSCNKDFT